MADCDEIFDNRVYDNLPYLLIPKKIFKVKLYNQLPVISAFVYQKDNLFGDPMPLNLAGMEIKFKIYNSSKKLTAIGDVEIVDMNNSRIEYKLKPLDVIEQGDYYGEFLFRYINDDVQSLPTPDERSRVYFKVIQ